MKSMRGFNQISFGTDYVQSKYQLRYAAGIYWLLDMEQEGIPYKKPLPLNETGACIWNMWMQGMETEEIVAVISESHGVPAEEVRQDVQQFLEQLRRYNIMI